MTAPGATELSDAARATDNVAGDCPRLLVVTDVFLDSNDPGAIFLRTLLEMYPRERLATCHLSPREASLPESLAGVRNITVRRPREHGIGRLGKTFQVLSRGPMELWVRNVLAPGVARRVADFGRRHGAELLLFVLNGPTTLSTARPVADELGVPLLTMVWDPVGYRLREAWRLSPRLAAPYLARFDETLRSSLRCAVMSESMQREFRRSHEVETVVMRLGVPRSYWREPLASPRGSDGEFVITFAGGLYARDEWDALTAALDLAGWRVAGREVRIRFLGGELAAVASHPRRIEFLGWHTRASSVDILARSDLAYLPYWLDERFAEPARMSFPSKLSAYVAAACPVLFHGPRDASVSEFMKRYPIGAVCHSNDSEEILRTLERCATDPDFRSEALRAGRRALEDEFDLAVFRRRFATLLGVAEECLLPVES